MKLNRILQVALLAGLLVLGYYLYGGSAVPSGQPQLTRINAQNFAELKQEFNATQDRVRVVAMLSPT